MPDASGRGWRGEESEVAARCVVPGLGCEASERWVGGRVDRKSNGRDADARMAV